MTRQAAAYVLPLGAALTVAGALTGAVTGSATGALADPVVVELFTSQGCAACPPADALLAELAGREDVLPLALHVDYWDYIGWADTFALPAFTLRQKRYAHAAGRSMIFTPQIIVDGTWDIAGTKPMKVADAIERAAAVAERVGLELVPGPGEIVIRILPETVVPGGGQVILARFLPHEQVTIERGENAGQVLDYVNVVSEWRDLGHWDGTGPAEIRAEFSGDAPGAVLVQGFRGEAPGPMLAAARLP